MGRETDLPQRPSSILSHSPAPARHRHRRHSLGVARPGTYGDKPYFMQGCV